MFYSQLLHLAQGLSPGGTHILRHTPQKWVGFCKKSLDIVPFFTKKSLAKGRFFTIFLGSYSKT